MEENLRKVGFASRLSSVRQRVSQVAYWSVVALLFVVKQLLFVAVTSLQPDKNDLFVDLSHLQATSTQGTGPVLLSVKLPGGEVIQVPLPISAPQRALRLPRISQASWDSTENRSCTFHGFFSGLSRERGLFGRRRSSLLNWTRGIAA
jgi:hypothetical protein